MKKDTSNSSSLDKSVDWKAKSIERSYQNKAANKRIRELTYSRDNWKNKHAKVKREMNILSSELGKIKKKLNEILN